MEGRKAVGGGGGLTCVICWASSLEPKQNFPEDVDEGVAIRDGVLATFRNQILNSAWEGVGQGEEEEAEGVGFGVGGVSTVEPHPPGLPEHFSVCMECLILLNKATQCWAEVAKVEARVRALQEQEVKLNPHPQRGIDMGSEVKELQGRILSEMRELKQRMSWFYDDTKAIAEVIMKVRVPRKSQSVELEGEALVRKLRGEIWKVAMELEPIYKLPVTRPSVSILPHGTGNQGMMEEGNSNSPNSDIFAWKPTQAPGGARKLRMETLQFQNVGNYGTQAEGLSQFPAMPPSSSGSGSIVGPKPRVTRKYIRKIRRESQLFKCSICNYVCRDGALRVAKHMEIHKAQGKKFKCSKCPSYFKIPLGLVNHDNVFHKKVKRNIRNERLLWPHVEVIPSPTEKYKRMYKCKLCGSIFTQRSSTNTHIRNLHISRETLLKI